MQPRPAWLPVLGRTQASVFVVDGRQRIILWNKGAERLLGYSAAQVIGKPCYRVIAGARADRAWCRPDCQVQRELRCNALPADVALLAHTRAGRPIWIGLSILAIPSGGGQLAVHLMRDLTEEKRNEEKLEAVLGALAGVDATGAEGRGARPAPRALPSSIGVLTRREAEVLGLLSQGVPSKAIAGRMGISPLTVRKHVQNALARLGMHSRVAAIVFALQKGILPGR